MKKKLITVMLLLFLVVLVSETYLNNPVFNPGNLRYNDFQKDSDSLVIGSITAYQNGLPRKYGLGGCSVPEDPNVAPSYGEYASQVGLQGFFFSWLSSFTEPENVLNMITEFCCRAMAVCVVAVAYLLRKKYNFVAAAAFFLCFWLSPWVTLFAKSIYWVEFTWILPTVCGLVFSIWRDSKPVRIGCWVGLFLSVLIKCLCGYEYLTFVMLGAIFPLLIDLIAHLIERDWKAVWKDFLDTLILGLVAVAGFVLALLIHARLRGGGDILSGLKIIYEEDVLRRTLGGDPNLFDPVYASSLNATISDTIELYFKWSDQVIVGIDSNLFMPMIYGTILILVWNLYKGYPVKRDVVAFILAYLSSISWFVLAKSHSFIHTHMNYVCWYYFLVPVCLYIILKQVKMSVQRLRIAETENTPGV